jgi:poly(3-hydroxybutyrate) depolymerase
VTLTSSITRLASATIVVVLCACAVPGLPTTADVAGIMEPGKRAEPMTPGSAWREGKNLFVHVPPGRHDRLQPAVLYLHGGSQRGTDLERLKSYGPVRMLAEGWQPPFILIAPQLPENATWDDAAGLARMIDELAARYSIDPRRVTVVGISLGGRGAWQLAHEFPDRVAAIAPVAAYLPRVEWASNPRLRPVAVRAYHGDLDKLAPYAVAAAMHEALRAAGGNSELVTLQGRDHFVADVLHDPALYDWLLGQASQTPM